MIITKIDKLVQETQAITQYPPEVVSDVVRFIFKYTREFLLNPTHAGLRLPHLGVIRPINNTINHYLTAKLIPKLRKDRDNEELKAIFRKIWKLRRAVQEKEASRNFKKRFGSWHFKSKE